MRPIPQLALAKNVPAPLIPLSTKPPVKTSAEIARPALKAAPHLVSPIIVPAPATLAAMWRGVRPAARQAAVAILRKLAPALIILVPVIPSSPIPLFVPLARSVIPPPAPARERATA